ncbi:MAG: YitT family protein [Oscillospiraceae bacterium]|nr:YitT family protein [Oscillospiraceae bacterium]
MRKLLWTCCSILLGNLLLGFTVAAFIIPNGVIMGGATGLGLTLSHFLPLDTATLVLVLNLLALALGLAALGKTFVLTTIASSLLYPVFLGIMQRIPGITTLTDDPMLASLFGGGLVGVALGLLMRVGSSSGGTDVVNLVLHKWTHMPVSVAVYVTDIVILGLQALYSNPEQILFGIVLLVVETIALDRLMLLGQSQIQIFVVSGKYEEIRKKCLTELQAGITMVCIETGLTGQSQRGVLCVIPPRKLYAAQEMIQAIDPNAFLTITQIKEVRGQGFTSERMFMESDITSRKEREENDADH